MDSELNETQNSDSDSSQEEDDNRPLATLKKDSQTKEKPKKGAKKQKSNTVLKFCPAWLNEPELKDWLEEVPGDPTKAFCRTCNYYIRPERRHVFKHMESIRHRTKFGAGSEFILFNKLIIDQEDIREWAMPVSGDPNKAFCKPCNILLPTILRDLKFHAKTERHIENSKQEQLARNPSANNSVETPMDETVQETPVKATSQVAQVNDKPNSMNNKPEKVESSTVKKLIDEDNDTTLFCGMLAVRLKSLPSQKRMKAMLDIHKCMYACECEYLAEEQFS